jgi:hypothetical protein
MLMACVLGCDPVYELLVTNRCGKATVTNLANFERLTWGRVLDDVSQASVTMPGNCCDQLADVRSWANELHIIRNGEEVWAGPIVTQPNCRSGVTFVAWDVSGWLDRRVIRARTCFDPACGGIAVDGPGIAERLVRAAFAPDDPCVLPTLTVIRGGPAQERDYLEASNYVMPALKDLAKGALDFTTIGRRIVLMPEGHLLGRTALLSCDSFGGDVCTTEDGLGLATRAFVQGKLPDNTTPVVGSSGGVDPFYGLVEVLVQDDSVRTEQAARNQAAGIVNARNPAPVLVQAPAGSALDPDAPVCINELVPGVEVPVLMDCTCRQVAQSMRLTKLDVTVDATGELVSPLLTPSGKVLQA